MTREKLYERITHRWYVWATEHGQVPLYPPKHGSQTHHMAMSAITTFFEAENGVEREVLEDVATFLRMQKKKNPRAKAVLEQLATALEDGTWEDM